MTEKSFHENYVAPVIVTIVSAGILAGLAYFFSQPSSATPEVAGDRVPPPRPPELEFPKDSATDRLLREYLADAAGAASRYHGKKVQICSCIALISPPDTLDLYGAPEKNRVEGIYFKCRFAKDAVNLKSLNFMQLVTITGQIGGYVHHPKSPHIILESCSLLR